MIPVDPWLADRLARAPAALRRRVERALAARPAGRSLPDEMRDVAERLLEETQTAAVDRDTALALLAADALITLACEYVAEHEPERLGEVWSEG